MSPPPLTSLTSLTSPTSLTIPAQLLLLLDSRAPSGAHGHSGGIEAAIAVGLVDDVITTRAFCLGRLEIAGRVAAAFAAAGCLLWSGPASPRSWAGLDAELSARTPSPALRAASRAMGNGLRRLVEASFPGVDLRAPWAQIERPAPHHPLVLGAACALAGAGPQVSARAAALSTCTGPASAAVRLLGLDPYLVQGLLGALGPRIDEVGDEAAALAATAITSGDLGLLPAASAPAVELLADVHARSEVRLFAS